MKNRLQADWKSWRGVSGVTGNKRVSAKVKGKVYRTVVRPAMMNGLEMLAVGRGQEAEVEVVELKMIRFSLGWT